VVTFALPAPLIRQENHVLRSASRTGDAIGPALAGEVVQTVARLGEIDDCLLKGVGFVGAFHTSSIAQAARLVK